MSEIKRKHHYVWAHYLSEWAHARKVWCLRDGKIFSPNPHSIANIKDFYRLREMTDAHLQLVRKFIEWSAEDHRPGHEGWLDMFTQIFELRRAYDANSDALKMGCEQIGISWNDLGAEIDKSIANAEEDLHARVEAGAMEHLDSLRTGDFSFIDNASSRSAFSFFLAMQYMRTPKMLDSYQSIWNRLGPGIEIGPAMGVLRAIAATNIGFSIYTRLKKSRITLFRAEGEVTFITSDQPVVNLGGTEALLLYYPLSPKVAVLIDTGDLEVGHKKAGSFECSLADEDVRNYNSRMVDASWKQVYAHSRGLLIEISQTSKNPTSG